MAEPSAVIRIDYVEFLTTDILSTEKFYHAVFGWTFTSYGPDYTSFADGRIAGGFEKVKTVGKMNPLVVLYAADLEKVESAVKANGGKITKATFDFPGGRRFHFTDPAGVELAVWSEQKK